MKVLFPAMLALSLLVGCGEDSSTPTPAETPEIKYSNQWGDPVLREIYTAQDERKVAALTPYLQHENSQYRALATLAFASVQDEGSVLELVKRLSDKDQNVVDAAIFALGQTEAVEGQIGLLNFWEKGGKFSPRTQLLFWEALGKCGDTTGLQTLMSQFPDDLNTASDDALTAWAWGLYRFGVRGMHAEAGTAKAVALLQSTAGADAKLGAAHYLGRVRGIDLSAHAEELRNIFDEVEDPEVRMMIARSMGKVKKASVTRTFVEDVIEGDYDYRVVINTIYACRSFDMHWVPIQLIKLVEHENLQVAIAASEYFAAKGGFQAGRYIADIKKIKNWRVRANLYSAALNQGRFPQAANKVHALYEASDNVYEKGALLVALAGQPSEMKFIGAEMLQTDELVLKSYGMEALVKLRRSRYFQKAQDKYTESGSGMDYLNGYDVILEGALRSGDAAILAQAGSLLADTTLDLHARWKDKVSLLEEAQAELSLPAEIETFQELQKAIVSLKGEEYVVPDKAMNNPIDWEALASIRSAQRVTVETSKGNIVLELMVDLAPGSVQNFVSLIQDGFYNSKKVHRVVPNFVVQDGCPRGDGWGSPDFSIRSEFTPVRYAEGMVGMASAGPDTESSQWFITHCATPHLDGRYTIFARVVEGMDAVHRLEVGDEIVSMTLMP